MHNERITKNHLSFESSINNPSFSPNSPNQSKQAIGKVMISVDEENDTLTPGKKSILWPTNDRATIGGNSNIKLNRIKKLFEQQQSNIHNISATTPYTKTSNTPIKSGGLGGGFSLMPPATSHGLELRAGMRGKTSASQRMSGQQRRFGHRQLASTLSKPLSHPYGPNFTSKSDFLSNYPISSGRRGFSSSRNEQAITSRTLYQQMVMEYQLTYPYFQNEASQRQKILKQRNSQLQEQLDKISAALQQMK